MDRPLFIIHYAACWIPWSAYAYALHCIAHHCMKEMRQDKQIGKRRLVNYLNIPLCFFLDIICNFNPTSFNPQHGKLRQFDSSNLLIKQKLFLSDNASIPFNSLSLSPSLFFIPIFSAVAESQTQWWRTD
jgi:hypothetical protein